MFKDILQSLSLIERNQIENPIFETLRLFDLLAGGAFRRTTLADLPEQNINLTTAIEKRKDGMPWEYILGKAHFMGQLFECNVETLIPTDETRALVNAALASIREKECIEQDLVLIELGTGCGNIAVSIALRTSHVKILASDISPAATSVAQRNVDRFQLGSRIKLYSGDLFAPFQNRGHEERIDFIVCNPPYIPTGSLNKLSPEIIDHEPLIALDGGPYGIDIFRRLIADSIALLKPKGMLFFEIGERQEKIAARLLEKNGGYEDITYFDDMGKIRALRATKRG